MLRICLISGQELPAISTKNICDIRDLKRELRNLHCFPVCLQQLLHRRSSLDDSTKLAVLQDGNSLDKSAKPDVLDASIHLQLVLATASTAVELKETTEVFGVACRRGKLEAAKLLLKAGAEKDLRDNEGHKAEIDAQIAALQSASQERFNSLKELDPAMKALVAEEREAAQKQHLQLLDRLTQLTARVDAEIADRRQAEDRTGGKLESLQQALGREQLAREAAMSENGRAVGTLASRLDGQERALPELGDALKADFSKLEATTMAFRQEERAAREAASTDLTEVQTRKHEAMMEDIRREHAGHKEESRKWALTMVERLSEDLRKERETLFEELNRRCQEVVKLSHDQLRSEIAGEVKRLDASLPSLEEKLKVMLAQERCHHEHQSQVSAQEVKAALEAHGELAEALESEQRLVVQRLTEGLQREGAARSDAMKRLQILELDVQK
ncbi:HERC1, partial [Symbiodinium pilosum]